MNLKAKLEKLMKEMGPKHISRSITSKGNAELLEELKSATKFLGKTKMISENIYCVLNDIKEAPMCPQCQTKKLTFKGLGKKYTNFCSVSCSRNSVQTKEKQKKTTKERYGVEFASQSEEVKEKVKTTHLKNCGYTCNLKDPKTKKKIKETCLKKYGTESYVQSEHYQEHIKKYNNEKYGLDYFFQTKKFKESNQENLKKMMKDKTDRTLKKYNERLKRFNVELSFIDGKYSYHCHKCGNVENIEYNTIYNRLESSNITICKKCLPGYSGISGIEQNFFDFIKEIYNGNPIQSNRNILDGKEIDILLREAKLGIEINGLYWHSDAKKEDKNYHLNKTELAKEKGIQLIQIFDDEIKQGMELVYSILSAKGYLKELTQEKIDELNKKYEIDINLPRKIYARKLILKSHNTGKRGEKKKYKDILEGTHIQGLDNAKYYYSLEEKGENGEEDKILSILTFKKMSVDKNQQKSNNSNIENEKYMMFELSRYVTIPGIQIVGGFQKMFKAFKKEIMEEYKGYKIDILTYSNLRYSDPESNVYLRNGFTNEGFTGINYYYFYNGQKYHRFKFRKDQLYYKYLPENNIPVDPDYKKESERGMIEKMNKYGIDVNKVFDCGHMKWHYSLV